MKLKFDNWCYLPTRLGEFRMYDTTNDDISVISMGDINSLGKQPLFRVHSSCRASEVFGALDCDCSDQLKEAMKKIAAEGQGIIVYQEQEGRGHGLSVKINAVSIMQKQQVDTAKSFEILGLEQDIRIYPEAVSLLKELNISAVRLISNNSKKHEYFNRHGIETEMVHTNPLIRPQNEEYLKSKNQKLGHKIPIESTADESDPIYFYHSDQAWGEFSNFSRHAVFIDDISWPTAEHYYQAQKFTLQEHRELIRIQLSPMLAKSKANDMCDQTKRADWQEIKDSVMLKALRAKFSQHPDLEKKLLTSGEREIIEGPTKDKYWGDPGDGTGQNKLGKLLMSIRTEKNTHFSPDETV